jgi:hypothetical protein
LFPYEELNGITKIHIGTKSKYSQYEITNNLEKIPVRIKDRPSRFDKKYKIEKPTAEDRKIYFTEILDEEDKKLYDIDKLTKPMAPVSSNPQTPVSSKPSDAPDTKTFQQWVINKKGDKTILGKGGDSGFGDDGQWGARTKVAWDKYKNDYELETNAKFQGINPNEDGSGENFKPPVATNR